MTWEEGVERDNAITIVAWIPRRNVASRLEVSAVLPFPVATTPD